MRAYKPKPEEIERLRVAKGWTLTELANAAGIASRTLDNLMAGKHAFISTLGRLAEALEVEVGDIAEGFATSNEVKTYSVSFKLEMKRADFGEQQLKKFLELLAHLAGGDIGEAEITEGSVIVTVQMTEEQIRDLLTFLPDFRQKVGEAFVRGMADRSLAEQWKWQQDWMPLVREIVSVTLPDADFLPDEVKGQTVEVTG